MSSSTALVTLKHYFRKIFLLILNFIWFLLVILSFYYYPQNEVVMLVGTEVKRVDKKWFWGKELVDIRFVVARDIDSGSTKMYRNVDFVLPPYFKFNSGDLSGEVMNLEEFQPDAKVLVTKYGLRVPFLSMYPNITSIEVVTDNRALNYSTLSLYMVMILFVFVTYGYFYYKIRKLLPSGNSVSK